MDKKWRKELTKNMSKYSEDNLVKICEEFIGKKRNKIEKLIGSMTRNQWQALTEDLIIEKYNEK